MRAFLQHFSFSSWRLLSVSPCLCCSLPSCRRGRRRATKAPTTFFPAAPAAGRSTDLHPTLIPQVWERSPLPFLFFSSTNSDATAMTSSSAIDRVVPHPDGSWFAATVNGGVWKTHNISESSPHWRPVTDFDSNTCPVSAALVDSAGCSRSRRRYRSLALASARCTLTVSTGSCM